MGSKPLHLGWFMNFTPGEWDHPLSVGGSPWDGRFYVDMAQALERACFDYIMIEDTLMVSEAYGDSAEAALKHALAGAEARSVAARRDHQRRDAAAGGRGDVLHPGLPAVGCWRGCARTLDHIAGGRFGWNIVTSGEDAAAQNFGMDKLPPREQRYAMADEYVDLVCKLFNSWDAGRGGDGPRDRHLRRLPQGPADPFRGQVLQGARAAEHGALAAGAAGVRAGRRLAARTRVRREARGFDHRHRPTASRA